MLSDPNLFRREDTEKGTTFFVQEECFCLFIEKAILDELHTLSLAHGHCRNMRVCLHSDPSELFHEMIILEWGGAVLDIHRHVNKSESIHTLQGQLLVEIFDEDLRSDSSVILSPVDRDFHCRIAPMIWHRVEVLSEFAIYLETKPGPYCKETDREFVK